MTYIGIPPGGMGFRFMRAPNNVIFTAAHALFDENMFPKCSANKRQRTSRVNEPADEPSNDNPTLPGNLNDDDDNRRPPRHHPNPQGQEQEHDDAPQPQPEARVPSPPPPPREEQRAPQPEPQRSGRQRKIPVPANSSEPGPSQSDPASSASGSAPEQDAAELALAQLCREGGVRLINHLLYQAVPVDDDLPNVHEWTYRDIARLPPAEQ
ncbi:hypothetical protein OH77DRAFT_1384308, partial [Trametes cingulata]